VKGVVRIHRILKNLSVGLESDHGSVPVRVPHDFDFLSNRTPRKLHLIDFSILVDLTRQPLGQGVYHGSAHTVESSGDFIAPAAELSAGV